MVAVNPQDMTHERFIQSITVMARKSKTLYLRPNLGTFLTVKGDMAVELGYSIPFQSDADYTCTMELSSVEFLDCLRSLNHVLLMEVCTSDSGKQYLSIIGDKTVSCGITTKTFHVPFPPELELVNSTEINKFRFVQAVDGLYPAMQFMSKTLPYTAKYVYLSSEFSGAFMADRLTVSAVKAPLSFVDVSNSTLVLDAKKLTSYLEFVGRDCRLYMLFVLTDPNYQNGYQSKISRVYFMSPEGHYFVMDNMDSSPNVEHTVPYTVNKLLESNESNSSIRSLITGVFDPGMLSTMINAYDKYCKDVLHNIGYVKLQHSHLYQASRIVPFLRGIDPVNVSIVYDNNLYSNENMVLEQNGYYLVLSKEHGQPVYNALDIAAFSIN